MLNQKNTVENMVALVLKICVDKNKNTNMKK